MGLRLADLTRDQDILQHARAVAAEIIDGDPGLEKKEHVPLFAELARERSSSVIWGRIS